LFIYSACMKITCYMMAVTVCFSLIGCSNKKTEFREAVENSDAVAAKRLINEGVDINQSFYQKGTACHIASTAGDVEMLRLLIENGADVNTYGDVGEGVKTTPLMAISGKGNLNLEIAKVLIESGANVNLSGRGNEGANMTALHGASAGSTIEMVKLLIENGADIHKRGVNNFTALHFATLGGNVEIVQCLLDNGADVNAKALAGMTPLHTVAIRGTPEMVKLLVSRGANINAKGDNGSTPLVLLSNIIKVL